MKYLQIVLMLSITSFFVSCESDDTFLPLKPPFLDFNAVTVGENGVLLQWYPFDTILHRVVIEKKVGDEDFETLISLDQSHTSYLDEEVLKNVIIEYRIKSEKENNSSAYADFAPVILGSWKSVPKARIERYNPKLVSLDEGKVIIIGGRKYLEKTEFTEIYVTENKQWKIGPALQQSRESHQVLKLNDGKIMVIGGGYNDDHFASVEIYNPVQNAFSAATSMHLPRSSFSASILADGRVLVAGGLVDNGNATATCEIYDPKSDQWTEIASLVNPRAGHMLTNLDNEKLIVVGGSTDGFPSFTTEKYDIKNNHWQEVAAMPHEIRNPQVIKISNDQIYVFNEHYAVIYDVEKDAWEKAPLANYYHERLQICNVNDRFILLFGNNQNEHSMEIFDKVQKRWLITNAQPQRTALTIKAGRIRNNLLLFLNDEGVAYEFNL